jgi:hypothetical protein
VEKRSEEEHAYGDHGHALQDAERARLEPHAVLHEKRITQQACCRYQAEEIPGSPA